MDTAYDLDWGYNSVLAEVYYSTGQHMPSHASLRPPTPRLEDLLAYADNFLYRDATPALPNPLPLRHQLDARVMRPPILAELPTAVADAHKKTGAPGMGTLLRVPAYINPGVDVAFQSAKYHDLLCEDGCKRNVRNALPDTFFWELGNPPLATATASALVLRALRQRKAIDAYGVPQAPLEEGEIDAVVGADAGIAKGVGDDFGRYAAIALNVVYDVECFGRMQAWVKLYNFPHQQSLALRDKVRQLGRLNKSEADKMLCVRLTALSRTFDAAYARYLDDLTSEAVIAAAVGQNERPEF